MTSEQKETLHRILLDAKAAIKDGRLRDHDGDECMGICQFVRYHKSNNNYELIVSCDDLILKSPIFILKKRQVFVAEPFNFSHPDRLALLDYLIESTKS